MYIRRLDYANSIIGEMFSSMSEPGLHSMFLPGNQQPTHGINTMKRKLVSLLFLERSDIAFPPPGLGGLLHAEQRMRQIYGLSQISLVGGLSLRVLRRGVMQCNIWLTNAGRMRLEGLKVHKISTST